MHKRESKGQFTPYEWFICCCHRHMHWPIFFFDLIVILNTQLEYRSINKTRMSSLFFFYFLLFFFRCVNKLISQGNSVNQSDFSSDVFYTRFFFLSYFSLIFESFHSRRHFSFLCVEMHIFEGQPMRCTYAQICTTRAIVY